MTEKVLTVLNHLKQNKTVNCHASVYYIEFNAFNVYTDIQGKKKN